MSSGLWLSNPSFIIPLFDEGWRRGVELLHNSRHKCGSIFDLFDGGERTTITALRDGSENGSAYVTSVSCFPEHF